MRMQTGTRGGRRTGLVALLAALVVTVAAFAATTANARPQAGNYILGVSNTKSLGPPPAHESAVPVRAAGNSDRGSRCRAQDRSARGDRAHIDP